MSRRLAFAAALAVLFAVPAMHAQVNVTTLGTPYTQDFNTLIASGSTTWTNNSNIPGWFHARTGTGTTIVANNGSSNAGNLYSYGTGTATDRALGSVGSGNAAVGNLFWGVRLQNNSGSTITSLDVSYTGEQWRNSAAAAQTIDFSYLVGSPTVTGTLAEFQSAGVAVASLNFTSPITGGAAGALDGNLAANRVTLTFSITGLSIPNGTEVMLRWSDPDHTGADHGLSIDDFSVTPQGAGPPPLTLSIGDVTLAEGNAGPTAFNFTVTLSSPAPPGGITFDIATQDDTAFDGVGGDPDTDYAPNAATTVLIPATMTTPPAPFTVLVNGDTVAEGNERFFVNISNASGGVTISDSQGNGNITNDDLVRIHDVQGNGASSPIVGSSVLVRGIVTGVKSNGFFLQEEVLDYDADPATSEGIFVFTSSAPPAAAVLGADVTVTGTVAEFVPSGDPFQPPLTELTSPTVSQNSTGNPLPTPILLTPTFPDPAGPFDQLERVEGMRVQVNSLTVVAPSEGNFTETNGNVSQNGRFYGVVTGVPRPFREAGIRQPDPAPSGSIPPIPRWDFNPERLKVESNALGAGVLVVKSSDVVAPVVGPLDYGFRAYAILPDGTAPSIVTPGTLPTVATTPLANEFTVASFNLNRLFNDVSDGPGPTIQTAVYQNRLGKASHAIRNHLHMPDVVAVQEVENLNTLQNLAARISADAIANSQPDPLYIAYLAEGNDPGGIDIGFLVTNREVVPTQPRLTSVAVSQEGLTFMWTDPDDNMLDELNDRPPLVLTAVVHRQVGASVPVTVINNHLRSLLGIESSAPDGLTTEGNRVRLKRQAQAEYLANLIQTRQTNNPNENIIVVGDFNAFEVNDGYADVMNVIAGTPPPDNETVVPGDGVDLVTPDLDNLFDTPPPPERYSYVHEGNAQNIDHALVNAALINSTLARRIEHPRIDADHPETDRNNPANAIRTSDHDPVLAYLAFAGLGVSDFAVTLTHPTGFTTPGANTTYTINVANNGPDAGNATVSLPLPSGTAFFSITPGSWSCTDPGAGNNGTVSCTRTGMPASTNEDIFVTVTIDPSTPANTILTRTATVDGVNTDLVIPNDVESENVIVLTASQYRAEKTVTGPFKRGDTIAYTITIFNNKPFAQGDNAGDELTDVLPSGVTLLNATADSGTPTSNIGTNTVTWNGSIPAGGTVTIIISATINNTASGTQSNQAQLADDFDDDGTNERNTLSDDPAVGGTADPTDFSVVPPNGLVTATKTASGTFVNNTDVIYTIVLTNNMGLTQANNPGDELTDVLPAGLTFTSANATSGIVSNVGNTVSWNGLLAASASVTITINAVISGTATGTISNQATFAYDGDGNGTNDLAGVSDDPNVAGSDNPTVFTVFPADGLVTAAKTVNGTFVNNTAITYTIVLTNNMSHTWQNVFSHELVDALPAGLTFVSANATSGTVLWDPGSSTLFWDGSLAQNASVTITINATINANATGTISNQALFNFDADNDGDYENVNYPSDDPSTQAANDPTSFTVVSPAGLVTATKTVSGTFATGSGITYTIVITNNMAHAQPNTPQAEMLDSLPSGITFVSANASSGTVGFVPFISLVTWDGSIPAGGSVTINIVATINNSASGTVSNQATVNFDADNNNSSENSTLSDDPSTAAPNDPTSFTVVPAAGLVTASKSVSGTFVTGTNVTYTITLTNNMAHAQADNVGDELVDLVQNGLTFVSVNATSGTATNNGGVISWNGTIPAGGSVTITMVATINANTSGTISNQATIHFDTDNDGTNENSSASNPVSFTVVPASAFTATKRIAGGNLVPGGNVIYEIVITNGLGHTLPNNAGDEFTDVLPAPLLLTSASATSGTAAANTGTNTVTWNGSLAPGASVTITIDAAIPANATGTVTNQGTAAADFDNNGSNEASVQTDDPDTPGSQPTAFTLNAITAVPVTKSVSTTGVIGSPVTYTVIITNNLPHTLGDNPGNEFIDVLPSSLILVSATATSGTAVATVGTNTVTWNGSIPSGGSVTITINATVGPTASGTVSNQGTANVDVDGNGTNETATPTDDPSTAAVDDPTVFTAAGLPATASIPALTPEMLLALVALLAFVALRKMTA